MVKREQLAEGVATRTDNDVPLAGEVPTGVDPYEGLDMTDEEFAAQRPHIKTLLSYFGGKNAPSRIMGYLDNDDSNIKSGAEIILWELLRHAR